jgi:hypothetical protein
MMHTVFEESVEGFVTRFQASAAEVTLAGRLEGSPLLECLVDGVAVHVFERTGPYLASSGPARVILNLECDALERLEVEPGARTNRIEVVGVSALAVDGVVRACDEPFLVVDAGTTLVVGVTGAFPAVGIGDRVRFVSRAPVHGFVLPRTAARPSAGTARDDQV